MKKLLQEIKLCGDLDSVLEYLDCQSILYYEIKSHFNPDRERLLKVGNGKCFYTDKISDFDKYENKHFKLYYCEDLICLKSHTSTLLINPSVAVLDYVKSLYEIDLREVEEANEFYNKVSDFEQKLNDIYLLKQTSNYEECKQKIISIIDKIIEDPFDFERVNKSDLIQFEILPMPSNISWFNNLESDYRKVSLDKYGNKYEVAFNNHCLAIHNHRLEEIQVYLFNFFNQNDFEKEKNRINH